MADNIHDDINYLKKAGDEILRVEILSGYSLEIDKCERVI